MDKTTIEIDLDIHKLIEANRRALDEPRLDILRRLLDLGGDDPVAQQQGVSADSDVGWLYDGVFLPAGTHCRMRYNGMDARAEVRDGRWWVAGQAYKTPTGAARAVAITKEGKKPHLNGWNYWEVRVPGSDRWERVGSLRAAA